MGLCALSGVILIIYVLLISLLTQSREPLCRALVYLAGFSALFIGFSKVLLGCTSFTYRALRCVVVSSYSDCTGMLLVSIPALTS